MCTGRPESSYTQKTQTDRLHTVEVHFSPAAVAVLLCTPQGSRLLVCCAPFWVLPSSAGPGRPPPCPLQPAGTPCPLRHGLQVDHPLLLQWSREEAREVHPCHKGVLLPGNKGPARQAEGGSPPPIPLLTSGEGIQTTRLKTPRQSWDDHVENLHAAFRTGAQPCLSLLEITFCF